MGLLSTALLKFAVFRAKVPQAKPPGNGNIPRLMKTCGSNEAIPGMPQILLRLMSGPDSNHINNGPSFFFCAVLLDYWKRKVRHWSYPSPPPAPALKVRQRIQLQHQCSDNARGNCRTHPRDGNFYYQRTGLCNTVPVALNFIDAPMQKNHTARMGTVPVNHPVGESSKIFPRPRREGVAQCARNSGTSIIPPGIFSIERFICISITCRQIFKG